MPLPGSRVIHPRWSQHHRPTALGTMTATCTVIRVEGEGSSDPDGTWHPPLPTDVYTGPCRVQGLPVNERLLVVGERQETHRRYQVSLRHDTAPQIDDLVTITASVDTGLVGKTLRVIDVQYGSEQWQRDLICDELEN